MGKTLDLSDDAVEPAHLAGDHLAEFQSEVFVRVPCGQELGESLDGHQRITDFVADPRRQFPPELRSFQLFLLGIRHDLVGNVVHQRHRAKALAAPRQLARAHRQGPPARRPALKQKRFLGRLARQRVAHEAAQTAAEILDRHRRGMGEQ